MMGHRLHLGLGYGILLDKDQKKVATRDNIIDTYVDHFRKMYDSYENKVDSVKGGEDLKGDLRKLLDGMRVWHTVNKDRKRKVNDISDEKERKEILELRLENLIYEWLQYPSEYGSKSFFGYIAEDHYGDAMNYALVYCLLFPDAKSYQSFEIPLPIQNQHPVFERVVGKDDKERIIPYREFLYDPIFRKKLLERDADEKISFPSETAVKKFVDAYYRHHAYESVNYEWAWELIKQMFPEVTIDDINRYLVGWWD